MTKVSEVIDELMTVNFEPSGNATDLYPTTNPFKAMKRLLVEFHRLRVSGALPEDGKKGDIAFIVSRAVNEAATCCVNERKRFLRKKEKF